VLATKALASKLARATYYVLKNDVDYDPEKIFERFKAEAQEREPSVSPVPNPGKETGKKPDEDGKKP
jgi:hypothetical protein